MAVTSQGSCSDHFRPLLLEQTTPGPYADQASVWLIITKSYSVGSARIQDDLCQDAYHVENSMYPN